jgi:hypothetical protein
MQDGKNNGKMRGKCPYNNYGLFKLRIISKRVGPNDGFE